MAKSKYVERQIRCESLRILWKKPNILIPTGKKMPETENNIIFFQDMEGNIVLSFNFMKTRGNCAIININAKFAQNYLVALETSGVYSLSLNAGKLQVLNPKKDALSRFSPIKFYWEDQEHRNTYIIPRVISRKKYIRNMERCEYDYDRIYVQPKNSNDNKVHNIKMRKYKTKMKREKIRIEQNKEQDQENTKDILIKQETIKINLRNIPISFAAENIKSEEFTVDNVPNDVQEKLLDGFKKLYHEGYTCKEEVKLEIWKTLVRKKDKTRIITISMNNKCVSGAIIFFSSMGIFIKSFFTEEDEIAGCTLELIREIVKKYDQSKCFICVKEKKRFYYLFHNLGFDLQRFSIEECFLKQFKEYFNAEPLYLAQDISLAIRKNLHIYFAEENPSQGMGKVPLDLPNIDIITENSNSNDIGAHNILISATCQELGKIIKYYLEVGAETIGISRH